MKSMLWLAVIFFLFAAALVVREVWPHRTSHYIIDAENRIVIYHGVNVTNRSKSTPDRLPPTSVDDFRRIRDWGFNLVRYLVFWEAIEPRPGEFDEEYLRQTLQRIDQLASLGIDVLIDFHQDLYAQRFGGNGFPDWAVRDGNQPFIRQTPWHNNYWQPAVWHSFDAFWRDEELQTLYARAVMRVLRLVGDRRNVVGLDIINEPWPWRGFGFEKKALTGFYDRVARLRECEGLHTPLYFAPMLPTNAGFRSGLRRAPAPDSVYAVHYYDALVDHGYAYRWWNRWWMERSIRVKVGEAERMGVPLFVGEFGIATSNPGFRDFIRDFTDVLEQHHVGWAYWSYDPGQFGLLDSKGGPGRALDHLVQIYPQRIAGRNPRIMRTPNSLEVSFDPIPTTAPTIVFIPSKFRIESVTINGRSHPIPAGDELHHTNPETGGRQTLHITWK